MLARRRAVVLDKPAYSRDRGERQRRADQDDELFLDADLNNGREVGPRLQERVRSWQAMQLFVRTFKKRDFDQVWLGLRRDDPDAKAVIWSYLRDYIESSRTTRPVLGDEEYEVVQTITCTRTPITYWKNLWTRKDLADMFGLIRESELSFEKAETTADDLLMLLDTLWTRAKDIP
ncbi:hypothetical protein C8A05DRAFT_39823, partial [Staphylotrichum tortipilum]